MASRRGRLPGRGTGAYVMPVLDVDWLGCRARCPPASPPSPGAPPPPRLAALPALAREGTAQAVAACPVRTRRRRRKENTLVGLLLRHPAPQQARRPGEEPPRARPASGPGRRRRPATAPSPARPAPGPPRRHGGAAFLTAVPPPGLSAPPAAPAPSLACPRRLSRGC